MNYYKVDPQYTALGPWSGCWECPSGTIYNAEKEKCVKRDVQKRDVDIDELLKDLKTPLISLVTKCLMNNKTGVKTMIGLKKNCNLEIVELK